MSRMQVLLLMLYLFLYYVSYGFETSVCVQTGLSIPFPY